MPKNRHDIVVCKYTKAAKKLSRAVVKAQRTGLVIVVVTQSK